MKRDDIYLAISLERERQEQLASDGDIIATCKHDIAPTLKCCALMEESGEVARSVMEDNAHELRTELIQVAAVAVAWLESLEGDLAGRE